MLDKTVDLTSEAHCIDLRTCIHGDWSYLLELEVFVGGRHGGIDRPGLGPDDDDENF